jgi:hypothetical protein
MFLRLPSCVPDMPTQSRGHGTRRHWRELSPDDSPGGAALRRLRCRRGAGYGRENSVRTSLEWSTFLLIVVIPPMLVAELKIRRPHLTQAPRAFVANINVLDRNAYSLGPNRNRNQPATEAFGPASPSPAAVKAIHFWPLFLVIADPSFPPFYCLGPKVKLRIAQAATA